MNLIIHTFFDGVFLCRAFIYHDVRGIPPFLNNYLALSYDVFLLLLSAIIND